MTINEALMQQTLDYIEAHPEEHNQGVWAARTACGTTACMAGHVVMLTGYTIDWDRAAPTRVWAQAAFWVVGGEQIEDVAARELGLTQRQADDLFGEAGDLDDLWMYAGQMTDGRVHR